MFTGIIEEVGTVVALRSGNISSRLTVQANTIFDDLGLGDSVAVGGVCLTVSELAGNRFTADVMNETLTRSTLGGLRLGSKVNLERALALGGRLGGHIVSGHIDGTGTLISRQPDGVAIRLGFSTEAAVLRYIVEKGSIAIDGISLTVVEVDEKGFSVSVIPHTGGVTTLLDKRVGDVVNLENDLIGKYVEKLLAPAGEGPRPQKGLTLEFLAENGY